MLNRNPAILFSMGLLLIASRVSGAGDVLNIPDGAKPAGLASAFVAVNGTVDSFAANPAGLASITDTQITFMPVWWVADYTCLYAAAAFPVRGLGTIGGSLKFLNTSFGSFDINGNPGGDLHFESLAATIGLGRSFNGKYLGLSVKYVHDRFQDFPFESLAFDAGAGTIFRLNERIGLNAGIAVRNIGFNFMKKSEVKAVSMPMTAAVGALLDFKPAGDHGLKLMTEVDASLGLGLKLDLAAEYSFRSTFFLRGGYGRQFSDAGSFSFGGGFRQSLNKIDKILGKYLSNLDIEIDYAMIPFKDQFNQYAHCLSVTFINN